MLLGSYFGFGFLDRYRLRFLFRGRLFGLLFFNFLFDRFWLNLFFRFLPRSRVEFNVPFGDSLRFFQRDFGHLCLDASKDRKEIAKNENRDVDDQAENGGQHNRAAHDSVIDHTQEHDQTDHSNRSQKDACP